MSGTPLKVGPKLAGTLGPLSPTGRHQKWVQAFALSLVHFYPKHFVKTDFDETRHGQAYLINKAPFKGISRSDKKWPRYGHFKLTLLREHVKPKLKVIPRKVKNFVETDFDETRHGQAHMINKAPVKGISRSDIKWPRYGDFKLTLLREHVKPKIKVISRKSQKFRRNGFR